MRLLSLNTVGLALIALALVIPTGAIPTGETGAEGSRDVLDEQQVELEFKPAEGPNGRYAEIENGNLSVDLSSVGVNPDATTVVNNVFTITNQGQRALQVWITHDGNDSVTVVYGPGQDIALTPENKANLSSGETITIGFRIDSSGHEVGETLMRNLRVHARYETEDGGDGGPEPTTTPPGGSSPPGSNETATPTPTETDTPAETPTATPTETSTQTRIPSDPNETVEVSYDVETNGGVTVEVLDGIPPDLDESELSGPRAIIQAENVTEVTAGDGSGSQRRSQAVVLTNTSVRLDGQTSLLPTSTSVDRRRRLAKVVRITPDDPSLEDQPATVRIRIQKSRLGDTRPENAKIGHRNETGWQLLNTRVVEETEQYVTLEARTPGFSVFGVWRATQVEYDWEIESIGHRTGAQVEVQFAEPGIYNATLTITDAFGQQDVTDYRILANDRPDVRLRTTGNLTANTPLNLTAAVQDEIGETTVTWKFEDGQSLIGRQVTRSFEPGRHVIQISVEDEYGAARVREFVLRIPEPGAGTSGGIDLLNASIPAIVQSAIVGGLGLALLLLRRRLRPGEIGSGGH